MKIRKLKVGQTATVIGYERSDPAYRHKLLRMGLIKGTEFKLTRRAPLGDPIELQLRGFSLLLRKDEADALEVELS
jgi:ferrous iron transport protein A